MGAKFLYRTPVLDARIERMKNGLRRRETERETERGGGGERNPATMSTLFRGKFIPDGKLDARTKIKLILATMPYKKVRNAGGEPPV